MYDERGLRKYYNTRYSEKIYVTMFYTANQDCIVIYYTVLCKFTIVLSCEQTILPCNLYTVSTDAINKFS